MSGKDLFETIIYNKSKKRVIRNQNLASANGKKLQTIDSIGKVNKRKKSKNSYGKSQKIKRKKSVKKQRTKSTS